jgi:hypothetical protein
MSIGGGAYPADEELPQMTGGWTPFKFFVGDQQWPR